MILQYYMVRPNTHPPRRANPSDAGLDLVYNPEAVEDEVLTVKPGESVLLQTGCRFAIPHGYMLEIKNRSSWAAKKQLLVGACVVDSGYDGEVFVNLHNIGKSPRTILKGDRIAQGVVVPVMPVRWVAAQDPDIYGWYPISMSERGDGKLGSTDQ
jgi:dUTP pyrophosphatase